MEPAAIILTGLGLAALVYVASAAWRLAVTRRDAGDVWAERVGAGETAPEDEAAFRRAFVRVHGPRGHLYVIVAGLIALVSVTPMLALLRVVGRGLWLAGDRSIVFLENDLVWQFYLFFGLIASWVAIAALAARRYHRTRPATFEDEFARQRERASS